MSSSVSAISEHPVDAELNALSTISSLLADLPEHSQSRIVAWISSRYGTRGTSVLLSKPGDAAQPAESPRQFPDVATLFVAAKPTTGPEKALTIAFWLQECLRHEEWEGFAVNSELKHLGHGVKNITDALKALIEQRPQLAVQLRKSGKTKQARKRYKLTAEGIRKVRQIVSLGSDA